MSIDDKNQNDIINAQLVNSYDIEYIFNDKPINRAKNNLKEEDKSVLLKVVNSLTLIFFKSAPRKSAPSKLAYSRSAPYRIAPLNLASRK